MKKILLLSITLALPISAIADGTNNFNPYKYRDSLEEKIHVAAIKTSCLTDLGGEIDRTFSEIYYNADTIGKIHGYDLDQLNTNDIDTCTEAIKDALEYGIPTEDLIDMVKELQ